MAWLKIVFLTTEIPSLTFLPLLKWSLCLFCLYPPVSEIELKQDGHYLSIWCPVMYIPLNALFPVMQLEAVDWFHTRKEKEREEPLASSDWETVTIYDKKVVYISKKKDAAIRMCTYTLCPYICVNTFLHCGKCLIIEQMCRLFLSNTVVSCFLFIFPLLFCITGCNSHTEPQRTLQEVLHVQHTHQPEAGWNRFTVQQLRLSLTFHIMRYLHPFMKM